MKKLVSILSVFALAAAVLTSCEDEALKTSYGETLVYMPQATHNLGVDNNLLVEVSVSATAENPSAATSTTLGVYRSGTAPKKAFSVDLHVVADTLAKAKQIAGTPGASALYQIYDGAKLLEEKYYEPLPSSISVKDGERQGTVQLVLKDKAITDDNAIGQVLCLPVRIENPTKYTLNENLAFTMVVVTVVE